MVDDNLVIVTIGLAPDFVVQPALLPFEKEGARALNEGELREAFAAFGGSGGKRF